MNNNMCNNNLNINGVKRKVPKKLPYPDDFKYIYKLATPVVANGNSKLPFAYSIYYEHSPVGKCEDYLDSDYMPNAKDIALFINNILEIVGFRKIVKDYIIVLSTEFRKYGFNKRGNSTGLVEEADARGLFKRVFACTFSVFFDRPKIFNYNDNVESGSKNKDNRIVLSKLFRDVVLVTDAQEVISDRNILKDPFLLLEEYIFVILNHVIAMSDSKESFEKNALNLENLYNIVLNIEHLQTDFAKDNFRNSCSSGQCNLMRFYFKKDEESDNLWSDWDTDFLINNIWTCEFLDLPGNLKKDFAIEFFGKSKEVLDKLE
jgi:hypothetical protein